MNELTSTEAILDEVVRRAYEAMGAELADLIVSSNLPPAALVHSAAISELLTEVMYAGFLRGLRAGVEACTKHAENLLLSGGKPMVQ